MNILFVLYGDMACNSANHVDGVARELCKQGEDCVVAVPNLREGKDCFSPHPYRLLGFADVLQRCPLFCDGDAPDFVHFWTPREINREFHVELASLYRYKTIIHLEDNEDHIARCILGPDRYRLAERSALPGEFPQGLSCPVRSRQFMAQASGFSLLIDSLTEKIPCRIPHVVFWPAVDNRLFYPRPRNDKLRTQLGVGPDDCVLAYHGNVHAANFHEVRSLYLAVALLNRRQIPTKLVRTGTYTVPQSPEYKDWTSKFSIDLGAVNRKHLGDILAMADFYVQPGTSDPFNDYRFPSKVPEFFAMGRPVVLPRTNVGRVVRHLQDAYVLEEANGVAICQAITDLREDDVLRERLAQGARAFSRSHLSWRRSAEALMRFYERLQSSNKPTLRLTA